ncbi:hypothetical protein BayCH28_07415 [Mycolicibacterium sp. CH28]|nr:hypothetical protein BayCH28_07415 [Mycolicibacterium sp. CH28]
MWDSRRVAKADRVRAGAGHCDGKTIRPDELTDFLHAVLRPGDRVALEGDNQKQADFLSRTLAECDPARIDRLHMLIPSVSRPEPLDLFERGIADKLDLCYAGPQSVRIAKLVEDGTVHIGEEDRRAALAAIAGVTPIGGGADAHRTEALRRDRLVAFPEDLKIETRLATRSLLAARSIADLVAWSGGLYEPPVAHVAQLRGVSARPHLVLPTTLPAHPVGPLQDVDHLDCLQHSFGLHIDHGEGAVAVLQ